MTCARVHDFVGGAKIILPRSAPREFDDEGPLDIVRPNQRAAVLVERHIRVIEKLRSEPARQTVTSRR